MTQNIKKDNLFLTIKGNRNDGSKFINEALKKEHQQLLQLQM